MRISVVTATYNSFSYIEQLVESLRSQKDKDFEWIVADGGSTDGTLEYLKKIDDIDLKLLSSSDFGIYDAINKAIRATTTDYYVVIGSDDRFYPNAISNFKAGVLRFPKADLFSFPIDYKGVKKLPKRKWSWLYGQFCYISSHSVGLLVKTSLHNKVGFYSRKFPIAADQFFILSSINEGAVIVEDHETVGVHGSEGVSGVDHAGVITEFYRVQIAVGYNKALQTILCCLRLLKNMNKL